MLQGDMHQARWGIIVGCPKSGLHEITAAPLKTQPLNEQLASKLSTQTDLLPLVPKTHNKA